MTSWLIDTALFKSLAPGERRTDSLRHWIETHIETDAEDPIFLSAASIVELKAAIEKIPPSQAIRAEALTKWLDGLVTNFSDRIHPVDVKVAARAGELMRNLQAGPDRHRFHDALLVATAQIYGHGMLTKRDRVFGSWTNVKVALL